MDTPIIPTSEQQHAIDWLVEKLTAGVSPVALRGYAGCGKSAIIPALRQALADVGIPVSIGSPTHRAAMILRRKGLTEATTLHAQALTPYFTVEYAAAMAYLGEAVPYRLEDSLTVSADAIPWLVSQHLRADTDLANLQRTSRLYGAKKALESLGVSGREHFDGFGPKQGQGCLIIDEASMLGREQLALCQQAFPLLCLIGDPGQLPPVRDTRVLETVAGMDLTQIHRQAAGSPILQLAYAARRGEPVWHQFTPEAGAVELWRQANAATFLQAPLLVWRNSTRLDCTRAMRAALYGDDMALAVGEPLVCRASSAADRADGFYNNALFRVVDTSVVDARQVTVMPDGSDDPSEARDVIVHLEELDGDRVDPRAVVFRFGYCLTVHTAQGGEWPTVAISHPDLLAYAGFVRRKAEHAQDLQQWLYTALTRAKQCVGFLTHHVFTKTAQVSVGLTPWPDAAGCTPGHKEFPTMDDNVQVPPSQPSRLAPMFVASPPPADDDGTEVPFTPMTDDIPEVPVPASVVAAIATETLPPHLNQNGMVDATMALIEGKMTDWVASQSTSTLKVLDQVYGHVAACLDKIAVANDHAQYQLANAFERLSSHGVQLRGAPYTVEVRAVTPQGFAVAFRLTKESAAEVASATEALLAWLQSSGYRVPDGVPF